MWGTIGRNGPWYLFALALLAYAVWGVYGGEFRFPSYMRPEANVVDSPAGVAALAASLFCGALLSVLLPFQGQKGPRFERLLTVLGVGAFVLFTLGFFLR